MKEEIDERDLCRTGVKEDCRSVAPETIVEAVTTTATIVSAAGGLKFVLDMVKVWIEARNGRRIKLKRGDAELELQGFMSDREIEAKIKLFEELSSSNKTDQIQIIIPGSEEERFRD